MMSYEPDLVIVTFLLLAALLTMAVLHVGSDLGGMGVVMIIIGLLFGWPFAAIGALMLFANAYLKRKKT